VAAKKYAVLGLLLLCPDSASLDLVSCVSCDSCNLRPHEVVSCNRVPDERKSCVSGD